MTAVNSSIIREYLAHLSSEPHLAGLDRDEDLARWVESQWVKAGLTVSVWRVTGC